MSKSNKLLLILIIAALFIGIGLGYIVKMNTDAEQAKNFAQNIKLLSTVFIRAIKMVIAPIVFTTLTVGIAKMDNGSSAGKTGVKAIIWFITSSLTSLLTGLILVNIFKPGINSGLDLTKIDSVPEDLEATTQGFSLANFINHLVPDSIISAMANNEILQIVVFSVMFGIALNSIGSKASKIIDALETISKAVLKMVGYVMWLAPLGVLGTMAAAIATQGTGIFKPYLNFFAGYLTGTAIIWGLLILIGIIFLGRKLLVDLLKRIQTSILIALTTTSSEAVFPKLIEDLEGFGCDNKIVSFILPLGYSFNLDGSMMYMTFASLFLAQLYGVDMSTKEQVLMLLVLMITSKGMAGVPRAGLIVVLATIPMFNIPVEGIALLLPIDHFCDMIRTATNVVGNALATASISKWEGKLNHPEEVEA